VHCGKLRFTSGGEPPSQICRVSLAWCPEFLAGMNPVTHAALQALTCGVDHDIVLIDCDGSPFLESEAVHFYKMKYDADMPESEQYQPSRQKTQTTGILLGPVHDPEDMEHLRFAKREDWTKVLRLLQTWGWAGNTVLMSNGNNGAAHDKSYFDRTLACTFWRKHRDKNERTVFQFSYMSSPPYTTSRIVLSLHLCLLLSSHICLRS